MIEMNGAVTGLITTAGHRDEIEIRRGYKESIWDPAFPPPIPIAPRRRRIGVPERLDFRGAVVTKLDEAAVLDAVQRLRRQGIESIAVCFLFSFLNPAHELRVREIIREEYPEVRISLSHEVMPTAPEFERTSTTLVTRTWAEALALPRSARAFAARRGLPARPSDHAEQRRDHDRRPAREARGRRARLGSDRRRDRRVRGRGALGGLDVVAIDMGGTSYEACLVRGGNPRPQHGTGSTATSSGSRWSRCTRSAPAAARSRASRPARCAWDPRARRPRPARSATARAVRGPPSRTRTSCSAT
jgi:N-methylhydantoinase A